jgi:hypothetical protein
MFDAPGSYLVQPVTGSEAVALPLIPVIERAARERSRDVEGDLINLGGIALFLGGLLRLVGALLLALARRPPAPTAEEASA